MDWRAYLQGFPVVFPIAVQWGEQDVFGHVNNTYYLRWCESARLVYFERAGVNALHAATQVGPIVAHIGCNFRQPVRFPDMVHVGARVTRIGNTSLKMEHVIVSEALGLAADAESTLVVYDYAAAKPHPVPAAVRAAIAVIEGREPM